SEQLRDDVPGNASPEEVAAEGERDADGGVQVGSADRSHEQDDREDHQPGSGDRSGPPDVAEPRADDASARSDEHEEEGSEDLRAQPAPLLPRIVEVPLDELELFGSVQVLADAAPTHGLSSSCPPPPDPRATGFRQAFNTCSWVRST